MRRVGEPIRVEVIALRGAVFHQLDGLEVRPRGVVALEGEGAGLNAADEGVARDVCGLRGAHAVGGAAGAGGYVGARECGVADGLEVGALRRGEEVGDVDYEGGFGDHEDLVWRVGADVVVEGGYGGLLVSGGGADAQCRKGREGCEYRP